jgi:hypothetical protein
MQRRCFLGAVHGLAWAGALALLGPGLHAQGQAQPRYKVSAEQLEQMVAQRFPLRYPVAGLMNMDVQAPALRLLPELNRLNAEMAIEAAGPMLSRSQKGTLELDFALRYEASDRTIRAHRLRFKRLQIADLLPAASELVNLYGPQIAEQTLQEVVLHQLRPQDLALAETMGLQPSSITVTDSGLVIGFENKPLK